MNELFASPFHELFSISIYLEDSKIFLIRVQKNVPARHNPEPRFFGPYFKIPKSLHKMKAR